MALQQLVEGGVILVKGSAKEPYKIRMIGGVVDCSCIAWKMAGGGIDSRTCKHIKANVDPKCLPAAVLLREKAVAVPTVRLTPKGKVSTAVGGAVVKDTAPPILLAHTWEDEDPTGWWISEKLDGVRAYWDGTKFLSRLGNTYHAPDSFVKHIPNVVLDGELWMARGKFQETISVVRKDMPYDNEWATIKFVVYDSPNCPGSFEDRMRSLLSVVSTNPSWRILKQVKCKSKEHLESMLAEVESQGGEGLMLRKPGSSYEVGRSHTLLKVKTFTDAEGVVVGYEAGKGKHKGRTGAVMVEMSNGKRFKVGGGFTDEQRRNPPKIGSVITYKHQGFTNGGLPRIATFVACRDYE